MDIDIDVASTLNQCASKSVHWFPSYDRKKKKGMSKSCEGEMFRKFHCLGRNPPKSYYFVFSHTFVLFSASHESNGLRVSVAQTSCTESHAETGGSRDSRGCGIKWRHYSATGEGIVICLSITSADKFSVVTIKSLLQLYTAGIVPTSQQLRMSRFLTNKCVEE